MILLNKKRILFILSSVVISIFSITTPSTIPVNSTPITNHTIILDAGHGFPDGGAIGKDGSIESELNLLITLKLQNLLESSNCNVILTRSDKNGIYDTNSSSIREKKLSDMKNRLKISEENQADLFISIHMNKLNISKYYGWQTFFKSNCDKSLKIADNIQTNLNNYIDIPNNRKIKPISDIYLAQNIKIPFVLVECGFLSNDEENKLLQNDSYQNQLAWSIYSGIMDYFKECNWLYY